MLALAGTALCPCDSKLPFADCCQRCLNDTAFAPTAEALMRSRYTAFVLEQDDYLLATWHPSTRPKQLTFDTETRWLGLKIKDTQGGGAKDTEGWVSFVARYKIQGRGHRLVERSHFVRENQRWLYVDGEVA